MTIEIGSDFGQVLLVPGMSVLAEVEARFEESLLIPRLAVDLASEPPRALRRNGSWVEIEIGACSAQSCILVDGLDEGAKLASVTVHSS